MAEPESQRALTRVVDRTFSISEDVVYGLVALLLLCAAGALLGDGAYRLVRDIGDGVEKAVEATLDRLLLVFILVELLSAVRATIRERKLVAEPFLLVGIIASIKEIVVVAVGAKEDFGRPGTRFDDSMVTVGTLGAVLLALAIASFLLRRKEREPEE